MLGVGDRQLDPRERLQRAVELVYRKEDFCGRQQRAQLVASKKLVARFGVLPEMGDRAGNIACLRDCGVAGQVIGECCRLVEEKRKVVFDAARRNAVTHVLVQRRFRRVALEHFAIPAPELRAACLVERKLACGQEPHLGHRVERALRVDVECANAFDVVAE